MRQSEENSGELKMPPEMIRAACDEAHRLGMKVAAHVESPEGIKAALKNGVDSIEHGAVPDAEIIELFKKNDAILVTTLSPAMPYSLFDPQISHVTELSEQYNGTVVFTGIIACAKACLEQGISVGLGTDTGVPYVTHYDMWRELYYFHKFCGVTNQFALHTATQKNAELAGIGDVTGTLEAGKSADMIVTEQNPLYDLESAQKYRYGRCSRTSDQSSEGQKIRTGREAAGHGSVVFNPDSRGLKFSVISGAILCLETVHAPAFDGRQRRS